MVSFAAKDLGKALGSMSREQQRIQENIYPDDPDAQLLLQIPDNITLSGTIVLTRFTYASDSFVLDHPVLGVLDSATLKLDGGYVPGSTILSSTIL